MDSHTNCRDRISNFIDTPWNSITFHRTPSILQGTPWNSMELQLKIHGIPWHYMELHGTTWHSMELHGYSMEIHGPPWNSKELHEYFMELHGIPWRYFTRVTTCCVCFRHVTAMCVLKSSSERIVNSCKFFPSFCADAKRYPLQHERLPDMCPDCPL